MLAALAVGGGAQAQSGPPTLTISGIPALESQLQITFTVTRSDSASGTLNVDTRLTQLLGDDGYVESSAHLGTQTVTLDFVSGTAQYVIPTVRREHHADGKIKLEILADSSVPAEYTVGNPSIGTVNLLHEHEVDDLLPPPDVELSTIPVEIRGPSEPVPEGSDAEFTVSVFFCFECGDLTVNLRVWQEGDFIDKGHHEDEHDDHDDHDDDAHGDDDHEEEDEDYRFRSVILHAPEEAYAEYRATLSVPTVDDDIGEHDGRIGVFIQSVRQEMTTGFLAEVRRGEMDSATAVVADNDGPPFVASIGGLEDDGRLYMETDSTVTVTATVTAPPETEYKWEALTRAGEPQNELTVIGEAMGEFASAVKRHRISVVLQTPEAGPDFYNLYLLRLTLGDLVLDTRVMVTRAEPAGRAARMFADAGEDRTVTVGTRVTLQGRAGPEGAGLSTYWKQIGGRLLGRDQGFTPEFAGDFLLFNQGGLRPNFIAPNRPDVITLRLDVEDPYGNRASDTVRITVVEEQVADTTPPKPIVITRPPNVPERPWVVPPEPEPPAPKHWFCRGGPFPDGHPFWDVYRELCE